MSTSPPVGQPADGVGALVAPPFRLTRPFILFRQVFRLAQGDGGVVLPRELARAEVGDLLLVHDTGAYGASMSSNYNSRPLVAEVLIEADADRLIRRRQTVEELLALENV